MSIRESVRRSVLSAAAVAGVCLAAGAWAPAPTLTFHTFVISELFSSIDGEVQFIELRENSGFDFQGSWAGHSLVAFNEDFSQTHTLPLSNLPSTATANKRVLVATANFATLPGGVTPNFIIPADFLFPNGRVQFAGLAGGADVTYTSLPTNGSQSRNFPGGILGCSPTNFAGTAGGVNVPPGSCCIGAACTVTTTFGCTGTFAVGGSCTPNPCTPATTGACCAGLNCTVQTESACTGAGSVYKGDNVACGTVGNPVACCPANFNQAGGVSVQDIFDFLSAYFSNSPSANFNGVGGITVQDIFDFLSAYFTPCPG